MTRSEMIKQASQLKTEIENCTDKAERDWKKFLFTTLMDRFEKTQADKL
jgi:hypothetical protein